VQSILGIAGTDREAEDMQKERIMNPNATPNKLK